MKRCFKALRGQILFYFSNMRVRHMKEKKLYPKNKTMSFPQKKIMKEIFIQYVGLFIMKTPIHHPLFCIPHPSFLCKIIYHINTHFSISHDKLCREQKIAYTLYYPIYIHYMYQQMNLINYVGNKR